MTHNNTIIISLADESRYQSAQDKLGGNVRSDLVRVDKGGRATLEVNAPAELSQYLREQLGKLSRLDDALREIQTINVNTITLWCLANNGTAPSQQTILAYLQKMTNAGYLVALTGDNNVTEWKRTPLIDKMWPISKVQREATASISNLKKRGFEF
jgi:hypothetical protein